MAADITVAARKALRFRHSMKWVMRRCRCAASSTRAVSE